MFFSPFILSAINQGKKVYLLCFSKGVEPGLTRYNEVKEAARVCISTFAGQAYNLKVLRMTEVIVHEVEVGKGNTKLGADIKDGQTMDWPADTVAEVVEHHRERWGVNTIVTFDSQGVSGHTNHKHTYRGVVAHRAVTKLRIDYYHLHTAPLAVKYSSWLAALYYSVFSEPNSALFINKDAEIVWDSMRAHHSQLVWFRRLYLFFSSYVYVNQLTKL